MYMKGQKVLVLGLGRSGLAATRLLRSKGAEVLVHDSADSPRLRERAEQARVLGAQVELGDSFKPRSAFTFCVISPGIDPRAAIATEAVKRRIPIISEVELGYRFLKCPLVAVTGTNGKSTTTSLVAHILRAAGHRPVAAGNIGYPLCDALMEPEIPDLVVLEVSSFQLEKIDRFRANVAVILNLTPNHLDRYVNFENYAAAKARIMRNMRECDTLIYKEDCADFIAGEIEACKARKLRFTAGKPLNGFEFGLQNDGMIVGGIGGPGRQPIIGQAATPLRGRHKAENIMAAAAVALTIAVPRESIAAAIQSFRPLPHRCEPVATVGGVHF